MSINTPYYPPFGSSLPNRAWSDGNRGYRFGFNGKEKDSETANDNYDFGARIYDGRLGRWLSLDPYLSKYPSLSGFVFSGNSSISFKDIDGNYIYIHYDSGEKDQNGKPIMKSYIYGSELKAPDNDFVRETIASLDMISKVNVSNYPNTPEFPTPSEMLNKISTDQIKVVNIKEGTSNFHDAPGEKLNPIESCETTVFFDPKNGRYTNKVRNPMDLISPPSAALNHELKHAFNFLFFYKNYKINVNKDPSKSIPGNVVQFVNLEEENTTLKTDNDFRIFYCLEIRIDYFIIKGPETKSATSQEIKLAKDEVSNSSSNTEFKSGDIKTNFLW